MKIFLQYSFFLVILCGLSSADLKNCTNSQCPPGGIWSEYYGDMPNYGSNSKYYPCNTQTCAYPAQRTCCIPYVPMVVGGKSQCGPLPKEAAVTSCCPMGGIWSEWSVFVRKGNEFERTRKCLIKDADCGCDGEDRDTRAGCPCTNFPGTGLPDIKRLLEDGGRRLVPRLKPVLDPNTCIFTSEIDTSSEPKDQCNQWGKYARTAVMRYIPPYGTGKPKFVEQRVTVCNETTGTRYFQFYCDFQTGNYRYYKTNEEVYEWSQISYNL